MRIRRLFPLAAILAAATIALTALPAHAITTVSDSPYNGSGGLYLSMSTVLGQQPAFYLRYTGNYRTTLDYQAEGNLGGTSYYYIHPVGDDGVCMTASTTQPGIIRSENCVKATNQYWFNFKEPSGRYEDSNLYTGGEINDPNHNNGAIADFVYGCADGSNGCDFQQLSQTGSSPAGSAPNAAG
jgi:hypothetical protein